MAFKGKPEIDRERCKGCLLCVASCPTKVLAADDSPNSWGYYPARAVAEDKCIACGNCYVVCPEGIIEVYLEEADRVRIVATAAKTDTPHLIEEKR